MGRAILIAPARYATLLLALAVPAHAQPQTWAWDDGTVPYVQTPMEIVERMMRMAEVGKGDYLIDLGSGDGRIVIEAAKRGARGLGVDLDPNLVKQATENAQRAGVAEPTRFEVKDIFETDLSGASVVAFYLLPDFNAKLLPKLLALPPGTRIVSHDGGIADWPADERLEMRAPELLHPAEVPGARHRRLRAGQGPAGAQQPPARRGAQDHRDGRGERPRLAPLLRGPGEGRPHYRGSHGVGRQQQEEPALDGNKNEVKPRELLSVSDGIVLICGMVIGAGIFKAPSIVAGNVSSGVEFV